MAAIGIIIILLIVIIIIPITFTYTGQKATQVVEEKEKEEEEIKLNVFPADFIQRLAVEKIIKLEMELENMTKLKEQLESLPPPECFINDDDDDDLKDGIDYPLNVLEEAVTNLM